MPAWNKINIPEKELRNLYINKRLSIFQISKRLGYTTNPIYRSLKEYKIPIRSLSEACTRVPVSRKELQKWYWKDKISMFEIADKLKCTHSAIVYKFKKLHIKSRGHIGITKPIRLNKVTYFFSFLAGYSDAEGCFYLKKPSKYRKIKSSGLEIQTQQKNIIWSL